MAERKKKILQVVGDPVGGLRLHIHTLLDGIDGASYKQSYSYSSLMVDSKFEAEISNIREKLLFELPLKVTKRPSGSDFLNIFHLYTHVRKNNIDLIHGHGAKGGLYARLVALLAGAKSVYTPHGGVVHNMFSAPEEKIYRLVEKILKPFTHHYIFESKYTRKCFDKKFGNVSHKSTVVYNGINVEAWKQSIKLEDHLENRLEVCFGVFGMLRSQKGQAIALDAMALLLSQEVDASLHLFGDGPDKEMLERKARDLGIACNVVFYGDVSNVQEHMGRMDAIIIPSLFESFGYVALEAQAMSKYIIASHVGGLIEVLGKGRGSLFVAPGDAEELMLAMHSFVSSSEKYKSLAKLSRGIVEGKFTSAGMISGVESVYQRVLSSV